MGETHPEKLDMLLRYGEMQLDTVRSLAAHLHPLYNKDLLENYV